MKKVLIKKVAIETTKVFEWVIFTNEKYLQNMVKVDLKVQFKMSINEKGLKTQMHNAQVSNLKTMSMFAQNEFGLGQSGEKKRRASPKHAKMREENKTLGVPFLRS